MRWTAALADSLFGDLAMLFPLALDWRHDANP
jgi:hypothetical protein